MPKNQRFTFLCSIDEKETLSDLSNLLKRSQGDTVRFLINLAKEQLENNKINLNDLYQISFSNEK